MKRCISAKVSAFLFPRLVGAMSANGTDRLRRPVGKRFGYWRLTGSTAVVPVLLRLTLGV
jgi:hypothetical protein